jgi:hypothetical protein
MGNFIIKDQRENHEQVAGHHPEGHITDHRNTRMKTRRQRRIKALSEGGQGPERATAP